MKKNMKKLIHAHYLILLLLMCNQTHGAEEAMTPIQDAHSKLSKLIRQKESGEDLNTKIYNEILETLTDYTNESTIWIFDANGNLTRKYNTKGWKESEVIKEQVETVRKKLGLLTETN